MLSKLAEDLEGMSGADIMAICKQIINRPLQRELLALRDNSEIIEDFVTQEDCEEVKKNYINVITDEMRVQFDAYKQNMDVGEFKRVMRERRKIGVIDEHIARIIDKEDLMSKHFGKQEK